MEPEIRLIHWYDTQQRRAACGAPGHSDSTKHRRGVTCTACLRYLADAPARATATGTAGDWVQ